MLARACASQLTAEGRAHEGVDLPDFDITDAAQVGRAPSSAGHAAVINCAAYTNVDAAEADEAAASRVNGEGVEQPRQRLRRARASRWSTTAPTTCSRATPASPTGWTSRSSRSAPTAAPRPLGEQALRAAGGQHLMLRTSWLYAPWANNFVRTIFKASREQPLLKVVNDQRGRPTSAEHLARVTLQLLDKQARGTLHVTDGGECTWYEFAREIVRLAGHNCDVQPCTTAEFTRPAKRPPYSVLDLGPTEALVGPMPDWHDEPCRRYGQARARLSHTEPAGAWSSLARPRARFDTLRHPRWFPIRVAFLCCV